MPISEALHIDNMKFMAGMPAKFFDIGIPDPPYGIGESSKNHKSRNTPIVQKNGAILRTRQPDYGSSNWDDAIPSDEYFCELSRVCRNTIVWGANYFPSICREPFKPPRRRDYDHFIKEHPTGWIIWDKVNTGDFNDCELAYTTFPVPTQIFYFMWNGMMQGVSMERGKIMQGNKALNAQRIHPTQKPFPLYQWALKTFAKPGDKLYDSHMGSQGSRIAAWKMGFDYWGNEIDENIFSKGCRRFNELTYEPLFRP